jgi:acyl-CoA dehydrogenase
MRSTIFTEEHTAFRDMLRDFIAREVTPVFPQWEHDGHPPRDFYRRMGQLGLLGDS